MNKLKRSLGTGISMLLLLLFSVTVLPLDFLHQHAPVEHFCSEKKVPCSHSVHITKKAAYCWICAIHYDKAFSTSSGDAVSSFFPALPVFFDNAVTGYAAEILYNALRGPPPE